MTPQSPNHTDSCSSGFGVYLRPKRDNEYALVPYYKCRWSCDAQAYHRIGKVAQEAIARHDTLVWNWLNDAERSTLQRRAYRQGLGFMSLTVLGRVDRCIIAAPGLLPVSEMSAVDLFHEATPQLVSMGITRLDKAKLWAPDTKGYEPLYKTRRTNRREVEELMADAGFINGKILVDRPLEYHIEALDIRLADTINLG